MTNRKPVRERLGAPVRFDERDVETEPWWNH